MACASLSKQTKTTKKLINIYKREAAHISLMVRFIC